MVSDLSFWGQLACFADVGTAVGAGAAGAGAAVVAALVSSVAFDWAGAAVGAGAVWVHATTKKANRRIPDS